MNCNLPLDHPTMSTRKVQRLDGATFRNDTVLRQAMHQVAAPSYEGHPAVLDYEAQLCESLYLLTDAGGLRCFFMVAPTILTFETDTVPAIFMGLSAVRDDLKGLGEIRILFQSFLEDTKSWEDTHGQRLLLFATFATPSTLHSFELLCSHVAPTREGHYAAEYLPLLPAIHRFLKTTPDPQVPFRLPRHAKSTRYSTAERHRIADICTRKGFDLFTRLNIDEAQGDRLILCCRTPSLPAHKQT